MIHKGANCHVALSTLVSVRGKSCLLLAVLEVDGLDEVMVRRGPDVGCVVSMLCLIISNKVGTTCKLAAWQEVTGFGATQRKK